MSNWTIVQYFRFCFRSMKLSRDEAVDASMKEPIYKRFNRASKTEICNDVYDKEETAKEVKL